MEEINEQSTDPADAEASEEKLQEKAFEMVAMMFLTDEIMDSIRENE